MAKPPKTILLHFLGTGQMEKGKKTGKYTPTTYTHRGKKKHTAWVAEAVAHFFEIDQVYLAATEGAREFTLRNLKAVLDGKLHLNVIPIPDGKGDLEIWQMFEEIVNAIPENTEIVIDVTNGFRSQPMLALAMALYLRALKNIKIVDIVYGAFEAKKSKDGAAPIISIRPFIDLIDWTFAIRDFERDGNAESLSGILHDMQDRAHQDQHMAEHPNLPQNLKNAADAMQRVSQALHLLRPLESAREAGRAIAELEESSQDIETFAKPFAPLIDKTQAELKSISYDFKRKDAKYVLQTQLKIIEWYLAKHKYMQAISLAREWVVAAFAQRVNLDPANRRQKAEAEARLNNVIYRNRDPRYDYEADRARVEPELVRLMPQIQQCRNDIDHANDVHPAGKLREKIVSLCRELIAIGTKIYG